MAGNCTQKLKPSISAFLQIHIKIYIFFLTNSNAHFYLAMYYSFNICLKLTLLSYFTVLNQRYRNCELTSLIFFQFLTVFNNMTIFYGLLFYFFPTRLISVSALLRLCYREKLIQNVVVIFMVNSPIMPDNSHKYIGHLFHLLRYR